MEAPLVLGEGMARHLVDKALQPGPPVLDEVLLKDAFRASLRNLQRTHRRPPGMAAVS